MKSKNIFLDINYFYEYFNSHLILTEKFTEIENLSFILKFCKLKPYNLFFGDKNKKLQVFYDWFDEFGNSLKITDNKEIKIIQNDLSLDRDKIICTDLYYGLSLEKITKISKILYLYSGKDDYGKIYFASFLGIDNYFRSYLFLYDEWKPVSTLMLDMNVLKFIFKNLDARHFKKLPVKYNIELGCKTGNSWLSYLPANEKLVGELENLYGTDFHFLKSQRTI